MTETWLNISVPDSAIMLPDFVLIRQDRYRTSLKKGGGICIYIKNKYMVELVENHSEVNDDLEILSIKVKIGNIKIGVYKPPKRKPNECFGKISTIINSLNLSHNDLLIFGDFNIDYRSHRHVRILKVRNFESSFNLGQLIQTTTRSTETTDTILDWVYTNTTYKAVSGTLNHNLSDHFPTFIVRKENAINA